MIINCSTIRLFNTIGVFVDNIYAGSSQFVYNVQTDEEMLNLHESLALNVKQCEQKLFKFFSLIFFQVFRENILLVKISVKYMYNYKIHAYSFIWILNPL